MWVQQPSLSNASDKGSGRTKCAERWNRACAICLLILLSRFSNGQIRSLMDCGALLGTDVYDLLTYTSKSQDLKYIKTFDIVATSRGLAVCSHSSFRDCVYVPNPADQFAPGVERIYASPDEFWISAPSATLELRQSDLDTWLVHKEKEEGRPIWESEKAEPVGLPDVHIAPGIKGQLRAVYVQGDSVLLGTDVGLFLRIARRPEILPIEMHGLGVMSLLGVDQSLWVGTSGGLLTFPIGCVSTGACGLGNPVDLTGSSYGSSGNNGSPKPEAVNYLAANSRNVFAAVGRKVYAIPRNGGKATIVTGDRPSHSVYTTLPTNLLVVNEDLYFVEDNYMYVLSSNDAHLWPNETYLADEEKLLGNLQTASSQDLSRRTVSTIAWIGNGTLWLGTETGLFSFSLDSGKVRRVRLDTGAIHMLSTDSENLNIGSRNGLFQVDIRGSQNPHFPDFEPYVQVTSKLPSFVRTDYGLYFSWSLSNFGCLENVQTVRQSIEILDDKGTIVRSSDIAPGRLEYQGDPLPAGHYKVILTMTDLLGRSATGTIASFGVHSTAAAELTEWTAWAAASYSALTFAVFVALAFAARWSDRCFQLLTDPTVDRFGLYFEFLIRNSRTVQIWIFERYYQALKGSYPPANDYVSGTILPAENRGQQLSNTTQFVENTILKKPRHVRYWIEGGPGVGKSELVHQIIREYTKPLTLRDAWVRSHFIPVLIALREFKGATISELARKSLSSKDMPFGDDDGFRRLFRSGNFLILLDGMNEVRLDDALSDFLAENPKAGVIATSQTKAPHEQFASFILPPMDAPFAERVLRTYLIEAIPDLKARTVRGSENPDAETEAIPGIEPESMPDAETEATPELESIRHARIEVISDLEKKIEDCRGLLHHMTSGYDVRLLAIAVKKNMPIPRSRMEMYAIMLSQTDSDAATSLAVEAYRQAWNLWRSGQRRFSANSQLTPDRLKLLVENGVAVRRPDEQFEFSHDLMRGYLAACWAAKAVPSIHNTVKLLQDDEIWTLSKEEQDLVFPNIAEITSSIEDLRELLKFGSKKAGIRVRLIVSVLEVAQKRGWSLSN
jgi:hypothetical protein